MIDFARELLANCSVAAAPRADASDVYVGSHKLPSGIGAIWSVADGLIAKRRIFRVFGSVEQPDIPSVQRWNASEWKQDFGSAAADLVFVAEDIFGDQYGYRYAGAQKEFVKFYCEDGQCASVQGGINHFIEGLIDPSRAGLVDLDLIGLAENRGLRPAANQHLAFRLPLGLGGDYSLDNLAVESIELHLGTVAQIVSQSAHIPDGTPIKRVT